MRIEEMLHRREAARTARDWKLSDELRDELRRRNVLVTDGPDGQQAIHVAGNIDAYLKRQEAHKRAVARFDAWLFSMQQSIASQSVRQDNAIKHL